MASSDNPYRGLPAEIRVQIWRLVVPDQVSILKDTLPWESHQSARRPNSLHLYPSMQIQLLYINREIYNEVLPIIQAAEIRLRTRRSYTYVWPIIHLAMQSPAFGTLYYDWTKTGSRNMHSDSLLAKLITVRSPHPLRAFVVRIREAGMKAEVIQRVLNLYQLAMPGDADIIRDLHDDDVLAPFAAASIIKGIVTDRIVVIIEKIARGRLNYWTSESLHKYMAFDETMKDPRLLDHKLLPVRRELVRELFYRGMAEGSQSDVASQVHIEVRFVETSQVGFYTGEAIFKRVI